MPKTWADWWLSGIEHLKVCRSVPSAMKAKETERTFPPILDQKPSSRDESCESALEPIEKHTGIKMKMWAWVQEDMDQQSWSWLGWEPKRASSSAPSANPCPTLLLQLHLLSVTYSLRASRDSHARVRTCINDLIRGTEAGDTSILWAKVGVQIFKGLLPDGINQVGLFSGEERVKWNKW